MLVTLRNPCTYDLTRHRFSIVGIVKKVNLRGDVRHRDGRKRRLSNWRHLVIQTTMTGRSRTRLSKYRRVGIRECTQVARNILFRRPINIAFHRNGVHSGAFHIHI